MRKIYAIGLALFATCAFCVAAAGSASAEVALWLANGNTVTASLLAETSGELTLENKTILGTIVVLCSGILDGTIGPEGTSEITEVLTLGGGSVSSTLTTGTGLDCTVVSGTLCKAGELAEVWPDNLPWKDQLELMAAGAEEYLDLFGETGGLPGWHVLCANGTSNLCEGKFTATLKTGAHGEVEGVINRTKAEKCEVGEGFVESDAGTVGSTTLTSGEALTLSMP